MEIYSVFVVILTTIPVILPVHFILALGTITCLPPPMFLLPGWLTSGLSTHLCPSVILIVNILCHYEV